MANNDRHYASIDLLRSKGIDFSKDYFELSGSDIGEVLTAAKIARYRKSKNAPGSAARMYYQLLRRLLRPRKFMGFV